MAKGRSSEPLPYYRWYWRDWRASRAVQGLHWQARGLYRELLDECWVRGFIPDDLDRLAELCGCTRKELERHWKTLARFFVPAGGGMLVNERLENERSESDKLRAERARIGKLGSDKRWQPIATDGKSRQAVATDSNLLSSSSSSSSSEQSKSSSSSVRDEKPSRAVAALAPQEARGAGFELIKNAIQGTAAKVGFRVDGEQ